MYRGGRCGCVMRLWMCDESVDMRGGSVHAYRRISSVHVYGKKGGYNRNRGISRVNCFQVAVVYNGTSTTMTIISFIARTSLYQTT